MIVCVIASMSRDPMIVCVIASISRDSMIVRVIPSMSRDPIDFGHFEYVEGSHDK